MARHEPLNVEHLEQRTQVGAWATGFCPQLCHPSAVQVSVPLASVSSSAPEDHGVGAGGSHPFAASVFCNFCAQEDFGKEVRSQRLLGFLVCKMEMTRVNELMRVKLTD